MAESAGATGEGGDHLAADAKVAIFIVTKDQGASLGGGDLPADAGSFDDDTIYFRVRHITGGATGDPKFALASDGTGTTLTKAGWS